MQLQTKQVTVHQGGVTVNVPYTFVTVGAGVAFQLSANGAAGASVDLYQVTSWPSNAWPTFSIVQTASTPFSNNIPASGTARDFMLQSSRRADFASATQPAINSVQYVFNDGNHVGYSTTEHALTQNLLSLEKNESGAVEGKLSPSEDSGHYLHRISR